ncbi:hypothetical protein E2C01_083520 [Portunus trituberculatus]|uniref:Uncharacterized protein n=1 Tax=Portunus trituberculatus TaxID=210409 RepID=A0A5B7J1G3_PORTR|nr:hypothetical protein [Portunus trituberculatus]
MVLSFSRCGHRQSLSHEDSLKTTSSTHSPPPSYPPPLRLMSRYKPGGPPAHVLGRHQDRIYVTFLCHDLDYSSSRSVFTAAADTRLASPSHPLSCFSYGLNMASVQRRGFQA